jgi:hypothetical protein
MVIVGARVEKPEFDAIERLRRAQPKIPSRSEIIRRLILLGLRAMPEEHPTKEEAA